MKVKELIEVLQSVPEDMEIVHCMFSEYSVLEARQIGVEELGVPRPDGWVHSARPDAPSQKYLVFPGN